MAKDGTERVLWVSNTSNESCSRHYIVNSQALVSRKEFSLFALIMLRSIHSQCNLGKVVQAIHPFWCQSCVFLFQQGSSANIAVLSCTHDQWHRGASPSQINIYQPFITSEDYNRTAEQNINKELNLSPTPTPPHQDHYHIWRFFTTSWLQNILFFLTVIHQADGYSPRQEGRKYLLAKYLPIVVVHSCRPVKLLTKMCIGFHLVLSTFLHWQHNW